jgi:hypothetical protein
VPEISTAAITATAPPGKFTPVTPCRVVDTRGGAPFTGGAFLPSESRDYQFSAAGAPCNGIPATAQALSLNITVTQTAGPGFISAYPRNGAPNPLVSTVNYVAGQSIANAAIVATDSSGFITLLCGVSGTHVIVDVNGYYAEGTDGRAWAVVLNPGTSFARSKGFASMTHPTTGVYCLTPTVPAILNTSAPQVSVEWGSSTGHDLLAFGISNGFNLTCGPASTVFEVRTYKFGATPAAPTLSDSVAFSVFIP